MKLLWNTAKHTWDEPNWVPIDPLTVPTTNSVWVVEVYDDLQLYINGQDVYWASFDDPDYRAIARESAGMGANIAHVLKYEFYYMKVEFEENEPDVLDIGWEWEHIVSFITTGSVE